MSHAADERSTEDIITDLMAERIRQLEADVAAERRAKLEILGRYDSILLDKHSLETRVALLEADLRRRERQTYPEWRARSQMSTPPSETAKRVAEMLEKQTGTICEATSDYFAGLP